MRGGDIIIVHDVAKFILSSSAPDSVSSWKLQKLVYFCQAWSLVWDERQLFPKKIEAWADGPVCPELYTRHRGRFSLREEDIDGNVENLDNDARETIHSVLEHYGNKTGRYLSDFNSHGKTLDRGAWRFPSGNSV